MPNEHWFVILNHGNRIISGWQREYNEERPKNDLGWLKPTDYAARMAAEAAV